MPYVRNKDGVIGQMPDDKVKRAVEHFGYTLVSDAEVEAQRAEEAKMKEAAEHPIQAAGENIIKGAVDTAGAPARALGGLYESAFGPNGVSDTLGYMTGDNALAAIKDVSQGWGGNAADVDAKTKEYSQDANRRAQANSGSSTLGYLGGSVAGMAPLGAIGGAARAGVAGALPGTAGRLAGAFAEGATIGGISGIASAEDEAHQKDSYLKGEQLVAAAGLPALLMGGLNLGGAYFSGIAAARKAAKLEKASGGYVPDLEVPPEPVAPKTSPYTDAAVPEAGKPEFPELVTKKGSQRFEDLPKDVQEKIGPFRGIEEDVPVSMDEPSTKPQGRRVKASSDLATAAEAKNAIPDLEVPGGRKGSSPIPKEPDAFPDLKRTELVSSNVPDESFGGLGEDRLRRTKYNPEARVGEDVVEHDLNVPGRKGAGSEVEDFRKALNAESKEMSARSAKVDKLLEAIPPGADPEWVMKMTQEQRQAFADYVFEDFGPARKISEKYQPSETTWRTLADAVGEREGTAMAEPSGHLPPKNVESYGIKNFENKGFNPYEGQAAGFEPPPAPTPQTLGGGAPAKPYEGQAAGYTPPAPFEPAILGGSGPRPPAAPVSPEAPPAAPVPQTLGNPLGPSYKGPFQPGGQPAPSEFANPGSGLPPRPAVASKKEFDAHVNGIVKQVAQRAAGRAIGGLVGQPFGPVSYAAGRAAGKAFDKMGSLVSKGAQKASQALDGALTLGSMIPHPVALAAEANLVRSVFYKNDKNPETAFANRIKELHAMQANNGAVLAEKVGDAFGPAAYKEQGAVIAATQAAQRGIDYLLQHAPKPVPELTSLTPNADAVPPNRSDLNEYSRIYTAVMAPESVLADIKNGTVTTGQIDAIKNVYPQWYQENIVLPFGDKLRAKDAAGQAILPPERRVVDTVLDKHSGVESFDFASKYGDKFAAVLMPGQPDQPKSSGRRLGHKSGVAASTQTQTSKMLGPIP